VRGEFEVSDQLASDGEIVAASAREPERFAEIFERHFAAIHHYLARRLGEDLADDLAAQVFLVAFERRGTFRAGTTDVRPWLYGIATNLVRNNRRAERRLLAAMGRLSGGRDVLRETGSAASAGDLAELSRALAALKQAQRDALLLHAWGGLSHSEIARSLGVPEGTVASRIARARRHLRQVLGGTGPAPHQRQGQGGSHE
jgi:RNA polymerase sigma factor (sigma-70 family)